MTKKKTTGAFHGGWSIDGVPYRTYTEAAASVGMSRQAFLSRCSRLGTRQVTTAQLDLERYRRHSDWSRREINDCDEWTLLSDTENTGAARIGCKETPSLFRRCSIPVCSLGSL